VLVLAALLAPLSGCSSSKHDATTPAHTPLSFGTVDPKASKLGICPTYSVVAVKKIVGGGHRFKADGPEAISERAGTVTGEACTWERNGPGTDSRVLRVEVRDFGSDPATITKAFKDLRDNTVGATAVTGFGDEAFRSVSADTSLLQVRKGHYLITASSRAAGSLHAIPLDTLKAVAGTAFGKLP